MFYDNKCKSELCDSKMSEIGIWMNKHLASVHLYYDLGSWDLSCRM